MRGGQSSEFRGTDRFAVVRRLGAGGMGEVYEALDRERGERVALKTLRRLDAGLLYRLKTEFRSLQSLHHPNLVSLGELIEHGGQWFFTMELVDGTDFVSYVRAPARSQKLDSHPTVADIPAARRDVGAAHTMQATLSAPQPALAAASSNNARRKIAVPQPSGAFDEERLRASLVGVVEGLTALHRAGLVHRDVKPSNLMVSHEGRVVLLDFGLVQETASGMTEPDHHLIGTPAYMAPEQAQAGNATAASDWYSLGVTLYQSLTGVLPFRGGALEMLHAKQNMTPARPSSLVDTVPDDLDDLCMQMLDRKAGRRPTDGDLRLRICGDSGSFSLIEAGQAAFVGRTSELAALDDAVARARSGAPVAVYVKGPSGVGKTALVDEFLDRVRRSDRRAIVLSGRCYERESVPFKALDAVIDSLSRHLQRLPHTEVMALLPPEMPALARVFPVLGEVEAVASSLATAGNTPEPRDLRGRAFEALKELLSRVAQRGTLVVFIDDLQWGDADSAALLSELLRPPRAPAMLLVGAFRSDEAVGPVVDELARRIEAHPARAKLEIRELVVEPLPPDDARKLALALADAHGSDAGRRAEAAVRESAGNPFFLGEMMRSGHGADGHFSLDEVVRSRVRELPEDERELLEVVAVVGRPIQRGLALRAVGQSIGGDSALAHLRAANFIRTRGSDPRDPVEFFHDRIRETVVSDIEPVRLLSIHQRIATVLEASDWVSSEMLALAIEFAVGKDRERAAGYALAAAERARRALAFVRAAKLYGLAIELGSGDDSGELSRQRAEMLASAGHGAEAAAEYMLAANAAGDDDERLELTRLAADNLLRAGHIEEGLARLREVGAQLGIRIGRTRTRAIWSVVVKRLRLSVRGMSFERREESEISARDLSRLDALYGAATSLGMIDHLRGGALQVEHLLRALTLGEEKRVCRALETETIFQVVQGGRAARRAEDMSRDLVVRAERLGDPFLIGGAHLTRGIVGFFTSRYSLANRSLREALRIFSEDVVGAWYERNNVRYWLYMAQISVGDFTGVAETVERAIEEAEQRNDFHARSLFLAHPTAWYLLREDRPEDARAATDRALEGWPEHPYYQAHYVVASARTTIAVYAGDLERAEACLAEAERIARPLMIHRLPYIIGELHKLAGRIALLRGDLREARRRANILHKVGSPIGLGLAALLRAPIVYAENGDSEAQRVMTAAIEHFEECGAVHLASAGRFRLGELRGGSRGDELMREAVSWMRRQGVANPERMVRFLAPRFGEISARD